MDSRGFFSDQNYSGRNSVGRGCLSEVAAVRRCQCQKCMTRAAASMEEYRNLMRQCPAIQKLILEEMCHYKQQADAATSLHLSSSTGGPPHGLCNFNLQHRDGVKTFDTGSDFPGNSSRYIFQPSGNGIKLQKDNHGFLENHNKVDYKNSRSILEGDKDMPHPIVQISQEESESKSRSFDYPVMVVRTPVLTCEVSNSQIQNPVSQHIDNWTQKPFVLVNEKSQPKSQPKSHVFTGGSGEHCNQTAGQEAYKFPQLPEHINGVHVSSEASALHPALPFLKKILLFYYDYRSKSASMSNSSIPFLECIHKIICVKGKKCYCVRFSRLVLHFDKCIDPNCSICEPERSLCGKGKVHKASGEQKDDLAGALHNGESNGSIIDKYVDILHPSKCQKVIPSVNQPPEVSNSPRKRSNDLTGIPCPLKRRKVTPSMNQRLEVYKAPGKRKNDLAGAFGNSGSNGTITDQSDDIMHASKCQKLENSIFSRVAPSVESAEHPSKCQKVTPSVNQPPRKRSNDLTGIPCPLKRQKVRPLMNQRLQVYKAPGKRKNDHVGAFGNSGSNGTISDSKCQKLENPIFSRVVPSVESAEHPSKVRTTRDRAVKSVNRCEIINNPENSDQNDVPFLEVPVVCATTNGAANAYQGLASDCVRENSENSCSSHLDEDLERKHDQLASASNSHRAVNNANIFDIIDNPENSDQNDISEAIGGVITNGAGAYQGLVSDSVPENSEKSSMDQRAEDLERNHDLLASASTYDEKMKLKQRNTQRFSITDYFTAGEMKEYLRCFERWSGQEVRGNMNPSLDHNNWNCQLCGMDTLEFAPAPMYCACCKARIRPDLNYYQPSEESGTQNCFCTPCHRASRKSIKSFHGEHILKANLEKKKNDKKDAELWIQCDICEGLQHRICALYNKRIVPGEKEAYICPKCWLDEIETREHQPLPKTAAFGAKDLPSSMLSDHIEKRLFKRLKKEKEEMAKDSSKTLFEVPEEADFAVRVVLSADKKLEVNQKVLDIFNGSNYPAEFPYRSKVILLFQKIEGIDVCLFGMYVQEYGSNCDQPNQRCVYISYIDSVKYLRPDMKTVTGEALRTLVYHEILIGYLDYCKKRGFSTCYLWACPPSKGEDYILYCHPESQKIPRADKLQHWYELMLKKAIKEDIAVGYTNLYDHFFLPSEKCNTKITAARLPYFDGDYWSSTAEGIIGTFEQDTGGGSHLTKTTLKAMGHSALSSDSTKDVRVMQKLGQSILPQKKKFMIIHLQFNCIRCREAILFGVRWSCKKCKKFNICSRCLNAEQNLNEKKMHTTNTGEKHILSKVVVNDVPSDTEDNDIIQDNNIFNNRDTFLGVCIKNNYQFDTLRRAKYSSTMILCNLHNIISVDM